MNFRQDDLHIYDIKGKNKGCRRRHLFPRCQYFLFNWKDTMKSWSRNVKKWILFLKITGILVILCMIAGACILYAAENHIQY